MTGQRQIRAALSDADARRLRRLRYLPAEAFQPGDAVIISEKPRKRSLWMIGVRDVTATDVTVIGHTRAPRSRD